MLVAICLVLPREVFSQSEPSGRACNNSDVAGAWSLVRIKPLIPTQEGDPDFMPHQVWVFTTNGKFAKMSKATTITEPEYTPFVNMAESRPELFGTTYRVKEDRALVVLQPEGAIQPYYFSCFVLTSDYVDSEKQLDMRKDDMLLDLHAEDGRTLIGHLFRKLR